MSCKMFFNLFYIFSISDKSSKNGGQKIIKREKQPKNNKSIPRSLNSSETRICMKNYIKLLTCAINVTVLRWHVQRYSRLG
jgi:hypothetical protein